MSKKLSLVVTLVIVVSWGCDPPSSDVATAPETNSRDQSIDAASQVPLSIADTSRPETVVAAFLDALRDGNNEVAEALLTTIARRETKAHELVVQPPGSPSARYEIGEVRNVQGGVHVNSIWSEYEPSGERFGYEIVWALREEPIGWRVAGMATAVNPAKPPVYLNFEDVPDLLHKWKQADAELAAQYERDQSQEAQSREAQSREAQSREAQSREAQSREAQSQEAQSLQAAQPGTTLQR